jgi:hypothetical protein
MRRGVIADRASRFLILIASAAATAAVTAILVASRVVPFPAGRDQLPATIPFGSTVETAAILANRATDQLLAWLAVIGWGTLALGLVTTLSLWADRAARGRFEIAIHRAVGASRRTLVRGALTEGSALAATALVLGIAVGGLLGVSLAGPWPHAWHGLVSRLAFVGPTVAGTVLLGALFPLWTARSRRTVALDEAPAPLGIAAVQLGASLALLVAGWMVVDRGRLVTAASRPRGLDSAAVVYHLAATDHSPLDLGTLVDRLHRDGRHISVTGPGGHLGLGPVDEMITDCGQCYVGGIFLKWRPLRAGYLTASADTFEARGLTILEGRGFSDQDRIGAPPVAVVNRYLASRYFQDGRPLGRVIFLGGTMRGPGYRVIGVVDDPRPIGLGGGEQPLETVYLSSLQHPAPAAEVVLPPGESLPTPVAGRITRRETGAGLVARAMAPMRWFGQWFLLEGTFALCLAVAGTAALMLLWVRSLRFEFAVRRAVGARQRDILGLVARRSVRTGLTGTGIALAFFGPAIWPELASIVPGTPSWSPRLVLEGAILLVGAALVASIAPLVRIRKATPTELWSAR